MNQMQLNQLWAFTRGDCAALDFERWFLAESDLEATLGVDLHWALTSGDYRRPDEVLAMRQSLAEALRPHRQCECPLLRDLCAVPMGFDGLDERVFATVRPVKDHGGSQWWLYLSRCSACSQAWMVAQDDRIFDEYLLRRLSDNDAERITSSNAWPSEFLTYEAVLRMCRSFAQPPVYLDDLPHALVQTAHDLRRERPTITIEEIAELLGIAIAQAKRLLQVMP